MRRNSMLVAVALIALLHTYVGCRLLPAMALPPWGVALGVLYLIASTILMPAPLLLRLAGLDRRAADALAWVGYLLMGAFSSLFVFSVIRDLAMLVWLTIEWLRPDTFAVTTLRHDSAWSVVALSVLVSIVGFFNARRIARVVDVELPLPDLPPALAGFTIVQLSDVHVGPTIKRGYLDAIVRRVNALGADLVALTGDITDAHVDRIRRHVTPLAELQARHGAYYVTGNHEYYHGDVEHWLDEARRLGLRVLLNENVVVDHDGAQLLVGGVTDYNGHHFGESHRSDPAAAVRSESAAAVKLLLAHQPLSMKAAAEAGFDVQLSGHTHGGQIWPWNLFVPMQQPIVAGLHRVGKLWVYVSRGTGYWGPPLRFGAPSEITRLRLVPATT